jgi:peroxiredoxin
VKDENAPALSINIGDSLPSLTLKNEQDEDVEISTLAAEKGVILFLVPKADTRVLIHSIDYFDISTQALQPAVPPRLVASETYIPTLAPQTSMSTA